MAPPQFKSAGRAFGQKGSKKKKILRLPDWQQKNTTKFQILVLFLPQKKKFSMERSAAAAAAAAAACTVCPTCSSSSSSSSVVQSTLGMCTEHSQQEKQA